MCVWENETWQWWINSGAEGLVGAVIGALVTGGAVWWTVKHERLIRNKSTAEAQRAERRLAMVQLFSRASELADDPDAVARIDAKRLHADLMVAETLLYRSHWNTHVWEMMELRVRLRDRVMEHRGRSVEVGDIAGQIEKFAHDWLQADGVTPAPSDDSAGPGLLRRARQRIARAVRRPARDEAPS